MKIVRHETESDFFDRIEALALKVDKGERIEPHEGISFESAEEMSTFLKTENDAVVVISSSEVRKPSKSSKKAAVGLKSRIKKGVVCIQPLARSIDNNKAIQCYYEGATAHFDYLRKTFLKGLPKRFETAGLVRHIHPLRAMIARHDREIVNLNSLSISHFEETSIHEGLLLLYTVAMEVESLLAVEDRGEEHFIVESKAYNDWSAEFSHNDIVGELVAYQHSKSVAG
ncbi:hypothetical protein [Pseudomonas sp. GM48]|uniref:hypothetical protein n=1 Tax=Pseudomonas sp. GM48 TaxID=1144330 RepID=UPI0002700000|nr:hypothetical protein [Pseudomonas sp. GM48]EJM48117.1 hypothetical protein PMI28_05693 [Pseudomonas sp. GM48]